MIKFITDCCSNHNQSIDRAYALIDATKEAGALGCKFQYFEAEKLYHPSTKVDYEALKKRKLPKEWIPELCEYAKAIGLEFGMSFFHTGIMNEFADCHFDFIKISSFDTRRNDLIREALICTDKQLIISTGCMDIFDIHDLNEKIRVWRKKLSIPKKEITYLHCVSEYPAKNGQLLFLREMIKNFENVGYSDHTVDIATVYNAVIMGAKVIEVHLDLSDKAGIENVGHCWDPVSLQDMILRINHFDSELKCKTISNSAMMNIADPEDGMRPLKEYRK